MIIQHNVTAMNSNRQLGLTTGYQAKSSEKLSSGYRINRAADDAAGLAISEKMRRQIRGLSQASENVQDGVSYVQIADAALAEIDEMLARADELCIKAANDPLTAQDREYIDSEIQALKREASRTFSVTSFNDKLIWDQNTTGRKVVGHESRPIYTFAIEDQWYGVNITDANRGAWPGDGYGFKISATDSGIQLKWKGFDGVDYESKNIPWPSEDEMKNGFTVALNSTTMDYGTYPAAAGVSPNLRITLDGEATKSQLVQELNGKRISVSPSSYSIYGTVNGDDRTTISGNISYYAGTVSRSSASGNENHISANPNANNREATDNSTMIFNFTFNGNADTVPSGAFAVEGKYSGSVYTSAGDRSAEVENVWWYRDTRGQVWSKSQYFNNSDLETAINNALNGTDGKNSIINNSNSGGSLTITFGLKTDGSNPKYKTGNELSSVGSFTLNMQVSATETAADIIARISNIQGVDITRSSSGGISLYNPKSSEYEAPVYGGTMLLNIQAGSEKEDPNVIPLMYDVLTTYSLGINDLNTLTRENALAGVEKIKKAAEIVDRQRSIFGAYQNRMEHTVKNLDNVVENTQDAESQIRDTDMAAEMVKYSNNNILLQAGQSILAQANQTSQGVLALLQ